MRDLQKYIISISVIILITCFLFLPQNKEMFMNLFPKREGLLNFGNTKITKDLLNSLNETATETLISVSQECQNIAKFDNTLTVECSPSDNVINSYNEMKNACVSNSISAGLQPNISCPASDYSPCYVGNIKQEQVVSFKASCSLSNDAINNFISKIQDKIENSTKLQEDALGKAIVNISEAAKNLGDGGNTDVNEVQKNIKNSIKNSMTIDVVNKMMNQFTGSNQIKIGGVGFIVKDVLQKQSFNIIADAMASNQEMNKILTDVDQSVKKTEDTQLTGITDFFNSIFSMWGVIIIIGIILIMGIIYFLL